MAKQIYFVTGTDTGVGKTVISAGLLALGGQAGLRTLAIKPVASGCERTDEGLRNEDALHLQANITQSMSYDQINPVTLEPAIAPHVAAMQAGKPLSAERLAGFCRGVMMQPGDLMIVEGAGGWRVPLNERETYADLPRILELPVILVVDLRLGCINHAMLSAEAVRADGLRLAGWVANRCSQDPMSNEDETLAYLRGHLGAPCLGVVPWLAHRSGMPPGEAVARHLALPPV